MTVSFALIIGLLAACFGMIMAIVVLQRLLRSTVGASVVAVLFIGLLMAGGLFLFRPHSANRSWNQVTTSATRWVQERAPLSIVIDRTNKKSRTADAGSGSVVAVSTRDSGSVLAWEEGPGSDAVGYPPTPPQLATPVTPVIETHVHELANQTRANIKRAGGGHLAGKLLAALAIALFLYLAYLFLDASTRGHFSWTLRLVSVVLFGLLYFVVSGIH